MRQFEVEKATVPAPNPILRAVSGHPARRRFAPPSGQLVVAALLLFALIWLADLSYTSLVPPMDNIEQLTWVRSLQWGYYKHPPLPTWLIWLPVQLFGLSTVIPAVMGAACTLGALGLMWHWLARLRGRNHATVALLAALSITYYNGRLNFYNHEVVLMLCATASAVLCWHAFATRRLRWWVGLGVALGLGALAKYQVVVTLASVLLFAAHQHAWRDPVHRRGALIACTLALVVVAPHLQWLRTHQFAPLHYAVESSLGARLDFAHRIAESLHWLVDQVFNRALPALIVLGAAVVSLPQVRPGPHPPWQAATTSRADPARALLLAYGLVPLAFMPLVGIVGGAALPLHWGLPFLLFAVPAAMELLPQLPWRSARLGVVLAVFLLVQLLLLSVSHLSSPRGPMALREHHWRNVDSYDLAERMAPSARAALGGPIRVIVGNAVVAGALALRLPERPLVLISDSLGRSPWVGRDLIQRCGAVEVGSSRKMADGTPLGPSMPDMSWRVRQRNPAAGICPPLSVD